VKLRSLPRFVNINSLFAGVAILSHKLVSVATIVTPGLAGFSASFDRVAG